MQDVHGARGPPPVVLLILASVLVAPLPARAQTTTDIIVTPTDATLLSLSAKDCTLSATDRVIGFTTALPAGVTGVAREKVFLARSDLCVEDATTKVILTER